MTENIIIMKMARESLKGKWALAFGVYLLFIIMEIILRFIPIVCPITLLIILGPITLSVVFLWLFPYIQVSIAKFYDDIKFEVK
jgi:uncharacterized membrane protein